MIQNQVEDPLSDEMLDSTYQEGDTIRIDYAEDKVEIERIVESSDSSEPPETPEPPESAESAAPALTS